MKRFWLTLQVVLYWLVMGLLYVIVAPFYIIYRLGIYRGNKNTSQVL